MTDVINPATGAVLRSVPSCGLAETDAAIERASVAFESWRQVAPGDRARLLRRFAALVDEHSEELAELEVANSGHTIGNARWEAGNVRDVLDYYAGAPERLSGRQIPVPGGIDLTFHEPLGVVGIIVPWNFPMPIAGLGVRAGAGGREHGRAQAGRADPADRDPAGRTGASRRACRRVCSPSCPARDRWSDSGS